MNSETMQSLENWIYSFTDLERTFEAHYKKHKKFYTYEEVLKLLEDGSDKGSPPKMMAPDIFPYTGYFARQSNIFLSDDKFINAGYDISIVKHPRYFAAAKHRHNYYEVEYVFKGKAAQSVWAGASKAEFILNEGSFLIMPPSVYHAIAVDDDSIIFNITLRKNACKETLFNNLPENSALANFFMSTLYSDDPMYLVMQTANEEAIKNSFFELIAENYDNSLYTKELANLRTSILFLNLLRHTNISVDSFSSAMKDIDYIPAIISYMEQNYRTTAPQDVAKHFCFSLTHIGRFYKKYTDKTLTESLQTIRLREAGNLLRETNYKVTEIANMVGYTEATTFTKRFKRHYGISPYQYRIANLDSTSQ